MGTKLDELSKSIPIKDLKAGRYTKILLGLYNPLWLTTNFDFKEGEKDGTRYTNK